MIYMPSYGIGLTGPYGSYNTLDLYGRYMTYGTLNLTESSPPQSFIEPLTVDEMKDYLKVPSRSPAEPAEDLLIQSLIIGARAQAENAQGSDLVRKQWDLSLDYWLSDRVELPPTPLVSVDLFQYRESDGTVVPMVEGTDYIVDLSKQPGAVLAPYNVTWPTFTAWPSSAITIRFTSGYAPDDPYWDGDGAVVKHGMRLLVSHWYNLRLPAGSTVSEWPYMVSSCISFGSRSRVY